MWIHFLVIYSGNKNKKLSCRKDTVRLLRGPVMAKFNWKTILRTLL